METNVLLMSHRLYLDSNYEKTANLFCNLTGQATSKTDAKYILGSWYEGYIYTLLLGLKTNNRMPRVGERKDKAPSWSEKHLQQYKYAISILLTKNDVINELNLYNRISIKNNFKSKKETLDQIKNICDEYSNGGLKYLSDLYEKDDTIFSSYKSLKTIFETAKE
jgi:hypothetical protein